MPAHDIAPHLRPTRPENPPNAARKEESGIRESRPVISEEIPDLIFDDEESLVYSARREAFRAFHELQSKIIHLVDLGLTHLKLDDDARNILLEVRRFPSAITPLYEHYHGRMPSTIFTQLPDERGEKFWNALARLSYDLKVLRNKAQVADKAAREYEEKQQARHTLLSSYFDPAS